jgi:hypothetical protein
MGAVTANCTEFTEIIKIILDPAIACPIARIIHWFA